MAQRLPDRERLSASLWTNRFNLQARDPNTSPFKSVDKLDPARVLLSDEVQPVLWSMWFQR